MEEMDAYIGIRADNGMRPITRHPVADHKNYYQKPVHFEVGPLHPLVCSLSQRFHGATGRDQFEQFEDFYFAVCNLDYAKTRRWILLLP